MSMQNVIDFFWYVLYVIILIDYFDILEITIRREEKMGILKNLITKEKKVVSVLFDKDFNVHFDLTFLDKDELQAILSKHTKITINPKTKQADEKIDGAKMTEEIVELCVKGWKGVTYEWLARNINIDLSKITNKKEEVPFSMEDMKILVKEAYGIDSWILDTVRDAANFSVEKEEETKN